ncbi:MULTISPECIES: hypothetical protein [unclassified Streptomyces]|uniref:hypothetical protein n=1 Tax=unclassified Streptomyces TaxID=2593676 RepID=UPI002E7FE034|nr:hypothetical protein [Streptomyces sp. NBC_00589]WTI33603.1 hypothetical protein OIC96_00500 [Streptomyces sp. NBC_00775]WUB32725.1 hypothetical protein OHA51_49235 [Streptomyces sp. NBC_00589]
MSNFRQRYWASLTDSKDDTLESLDHIIEHGRRKDRPLWRRYLASLLDVELTEKEPSENARRNPTTEIRSVAAPVRRNWLAVAASVLLVFGAGFGTSFSLNDQKAAASPAVIGAASTLPAGAHKEAGKYAWVTPAGWRRDVKTGTEVHYTSPDGDQEIVAKSSLAHGDLMHTWKISEQNAHQSENYRKIRLTKATFRGWPSVVWEYTFTLGGVRWHALLTGFNAHGRNYQISTWYQPDVEIQALKTFSVVKDSFTVL